MFSYKEHKIISAVPLADIEVYFNELGAAEISRLMYEYKGLKIKLTVFDNDVYPDLGIQRHAITVSGNKTSAEEFLTAFRFRFMSAGG